MSAENILVRGVNWLGDAVMTTPALQRLREAQPGARITLLTPRKLADIWRNHPAIDAMETFSDDESVFAIGSRLRAGKFDLGLIFPNSPRSALEPWLARIPKRIGYSRPWRNFFLTRAVGPRPGEIAMHKRTLNEINQLVRDNAPQTKLPPSAHHIHQYLHLVAAVGGNAEPLPPYLAVNESAVTDFVAKHNLTDSVPCFGLNAGAEYGPAKRWPEARFIEAAIKIQKQTNCRWLIFGLKSESEMAGRIAVEISRANNASALNFAGATTLAELCAALKLCRVLLTNDSGPMHVAAAVGTSVVVPFGSTSPKFTGPGLPDDARHRLLRANAPCSPCFLRECPIDFRCMTGIAVDSIVKAVLEAVAK